MELVKKISIKFAVNLMMVLLSCVVIFHFLILAGVIPYNMVVGGRLENASQMVFFEIVSVIINLAIIAVVAIKAGYIKPFLSNRVVTALLWLLVALFTLNTLGNIFSKTTLETIIFTPLTLVSAVLCYRLVIER